MQLPVAEHLLRNTENLAVVIGDVLHATSGNISNSSMTITQENIGIYHITIHWNSSKMDTIGELRFVLYKEVTLI